MMAGWTVPFQKKKENILDFGPTTAAPTPKKKIEFNLI